MAPCTTSVWRFGASAAVIGLITLVGCDNEPLPPDDVPTLPDTAPDAEPTVQSTADGSRTVGNAAGTDGGIAQSAFGSDRRDDAGNPINAGNTSATNADASRAASAENPAGAPPADEAASPEHAEPAAGHQALEQVVGRLTQSLASNDLEQAQALVITEEEYNQTFRSAEGDPDAYQTLRGQIDQSLEEVADAIRGGQVQSIDYLHTDQFAEYPADANFPELGTATLRNTETIANDMRVTIAVAEDEHTFRIGKLIRLDDGWRLLSPLDMSQ